MSEFIGLDDPEEDDTIDENLSIRLNGTLWLVGEGGCLVAWVEDDDLTAALIDLLGGEQNDPE
jgi:hypothetical protein